MLLCNSQIKTKYQSLTLFSFLLFWVLMCCHLSCVMVKIGKRNALSCTICSYCRQLASIVTFKIGWPDY